MKMEDKKDDLYDGSLTDPYSEDTYNESEGQLDEGPPNPNRTTLELTPQLSK